MSTSDYITLVAALIGVVLLFKIMKITKVEEEEPMTINVGGHIVDADYIIGIGPLQTVESATPSCKGTFKLYYHLHFENHTCKIETEWLHPLLPSQAAAADRFREDHKWNRSYIEKLLNGTNNKMPKGSAIPPPPENENFTKLKKALAKV